MVKSATIKKRFFLTIMILFLTGRFSLALPSEIFDWGCRLFSSNPEIVPIPHPGHDWPANHIYHKILYDSLAGAGSIIGLMLRDDTGPYDGTKDRHALDTIIAYLSGTGKPLHFCFDDYESATEWQNVAATCSIIRTHANPAINSSRIGHYAGYAGLTDSSCPYPSQAIRTAEHNNYINSDLDVSMPNCYPYEYYEVHTSSYSWGSYVSPNERSALFWAPLERFSVARRNLPSGHRLIPWIAGFVDWSGYNAEPPLPEDCRALLQHFRLRGADGMYMLICSNPNYPGDSIYEADMIDAWFDLEWFSLLPGSADVLNLGTDKVAGVEWSGMQRQNRVLFIFSNLTAQAVRFDLPDLSAIMPDQSPEIAPFSHLLAQYVTEPLEFAVDAGGDVAFYRLDNDPLNGSAAPLNALYGDRVGGIRNWSLNTQWQKVSGPGNVDFSNPESTMTEVSFSEYGVYFLSLNGNDGYAAIADTIRVIVAQALVFPNPFNPQSGELTIDLFSAAAVAGDVAVFDISGRRIWHVDFDAYPGMNHVYWNGVDDDGKDAAAGIYFCRINFPGMEDAVNRIHKIIKIK